MTAPDPAEIEQGIFAGDCQDLLLKVPDRSVALVLADPPFNICFKYDMYQDTKSQGDYLEWTECWLNQVYRVLTPNGAVWVAMGDENVASVKILMDGLGLILRNWVIWHYTFGVNARRKFSRSHSHLLYYVKGKGFTFNDEAIRIPSDRQRKYNDPRANPAGKIPDDTWTFSRVCGTFKERAGFHGCQMPEQLLGRIILSCSNPGDLVLDCFSGTGSTAVVSKKLGRRHLGFEISPEYALKARGRVDSAEEGQPLSGFLPAAYRPLGAS